MKSSNMMSSQSKSIDNEESSTRQQFSIPASGEIAGRMDLNYEEESTVTISGRIYNDKGQFSINRKQMLESGN